jgi:hypothetical protein
MGDAGKKAARHAGYLVCAAGFALSVVAFYPGHMSPDSTSQLLEGRAWAFTDWHPPLMAAVWGLLDRLWRGPFPMLLMHNALFWGACAVFWRATRGRAPGLRLALCAFGFLPHALALLGTVWKDVGMGASLLLASALLYAARAGASRAAVAASVPLVFYAYGVRLNAAPAVLPLALWTAFVACRAFDFLKARAARRPRLLPVALGLAYFLLLTFAVGLTTRVLTGGRSAYTIQSVLLHDLAAVSVARGEPLFPPYVVAYAGFSLEKVRREYKPYVATPIVPNEASGLRLTADAREMRELRAKWFEVVPQNAGVYLGHRWEAFKWATGLGQPYVCFPYLLAPYNPPAHAVRDSAPHRLLKTYFWALKDTIFFRGFFWLTLSAGLVYFSLRGRLRGDLEAVFVLNASGLLYGLAYFFFAPSCDFRFFWWTALAATVSLIFFAAYVVDRRQKSRAADEEG